MHSLRLGALAICLSSIAFCESYPMVWQLAHPDAKALVGIDWLRIRQSSGGRLFSGDIQKSGMGFFHLSGMEILDHVNQVFISSPGKISAEDKSQPPVVIVITGNFDLAQMRQTLKGTWSTYKTVPVFASSKATATLRLALLNEQTLVAADERSLTDAIDRQRATQTEKPYNAMLGHAAKMAATYDFWMITTGSPKSFAGSGVPIGQMAAEINGIEAGISFRNGLALQFNLNTKTEAAAQSLAAEMHKMLKLAAEEKKDQQQPGMVEMARKVKIQADHDSVHIDMSVDRAQLEKSMHEMRAARERAAATRAAITMTPEPAGPKKIRIEGLDEGTREIPVP